MRNPGARASVAPAQHFGAKEQTMRIGISLGGIILILILLWLIF
ncbi:MAG TPA: hypothetical protein VEZ70_04940 [Allosphingosinicella sp.]|nr:hypothetical protein [Allosphingosinicella sp.]